MKFWVRLGLAILAGWFVYIVLLAIGTSVEGAKSVLWNVGFFAGLAGDGPVIGHHPDGSPMHEGTPVHLFFFVVGLLSGFVIYPLAIFIILTIVHRLRGEKETEF